MQSAPITKYKRLPVVNLPDRQWPNKVVEHAPTWCSVDLRDGNQALAQPMSIEEKLEFFQVLVDIGFKQIEVGFPSASPSEFALCRRLIEEKRIPADVTIQILCPCREDLIKTSLEALSGAKKIIFHLYNSTSPLQREYVFNASKEATIALALSGVDALNKHKALLPPGTELQLQYSPESFTSTELEFALDICEAVTQAWNPSEHNKIILNLPATVEYATPNVHADQIEWICRHLTRRTHTQVSLHTHNDRGTGVAATELALLAGADRVEGTLFGNGERTGNLDLVTLALNLYTHGIDPQLDLSNLNEIKDTYERITRMSVHSRHPYAGDLVFTAFSGSHQDAIKKSWAKQTASTPWNVLYIPIDPADIGRDYKEIIRITSQSGKGGVAFILETEFGYRLPKNMQKEFGKIVNDVADSKGIELNSALILKLFDETYLRTAPIEIKSFKSVEHETKVICQAELAINGKVTLITGFGNGPIAAFSNALKEVPLLPEISVLDYEEHSLGKGASAAAASYVLVKAHNTSLYGVGIDTNIELASIKAIVSAINRVLTT